MITFACNSCAKKLRLDDTHAGKKVRCPACQAVNVVPRAEAPPEAVSAEPAPFVEPVAPPVEPAGVDTEPVAPARKPRREAPPDEGDEPEERPAPKRKPRPQPAKGSSAWVPVLVSLGMAFVGFAILTAGIAVAVTAEERPKQQQFQGQIPVQQQWQTFSPNEADYSVSLPGAPVGEPLGVPGQAGKRYVLDRMADGIRYITLQGDVAAQVAGPALLDKMYRAERDDALKQGGRVVSERDVKLGALKGKEFRIDANGGRLKVTRIYLGQAGGRSHFWVVAVEGNKARVEGPDGQRFFESFAVRGLPPDGNPGRGDPPGKDRQKDKGKIAAPPEGERAVWAGSVNSMCMAFSPDSAVLAAGDRDRLRLWDHAAANARISQAEKGAAICAVAYRPDGKRIAYGTEKGVVVLRDVEAGKEAGKEARRWQVSNDEAKRPAWAVTCLAFSPDGKRLAVGVWMDAGSGAVQLVEAEKGQQVALMRCEKAPRKLTFSRSGPLVAFFINKTCVCDPETLAVRREFTEEHPSERIVASTLSPDGKTLAVVGAGGTALLWDVASGDLKAMWPVELRASPPQPHEHSLEFSPDGKTLVLGTVGPALQVYDVSTGDGRRLSLGARPAAVGLLAFSPDGKLLALSAGGPRILEADRLKKLLAEPAPKKVPTPPEGERLVWAEVNPNRAVALAFSPDGKTLTVGHQDGRLRYWDPAAGKDRGRRFEKLGRISSVAYRPDGKRLAYGTGQGTVVVVDLEANKASRYQILHENAKESSTVRSLAFSRDGKSLAVGLEPGGNSNGEVHLIDPETGKVTASMRRCQETPVKLAFAPDGPLVVIFPRKFRVCDPATLEVRRESKVDKGPAWYVSADLSPDGKTLAVLCNDKKVRSFEVSSGDEKAAWPTADSLRIVPGLPLVYSPDGSYLVLGTLESAMYLIDAKTGKQSKVVLNRGRSPSLFAFSPDGKLLAIQTSDGPKILEAPRLKELLGK